MSERARLAVRMPRIKRERLVSRKHKNGCSKPASSPVERILHLQRTIGNQAVQRLFDNGLIQATLKIGQPNDRYEQEADRVAERVMRMPVLAVQTNPG